MEKQTLLLWEPAETWPLAKVVLYLYLLRHLSSHRKTLIPAHRHCLWSSFRIPFPTGSESFPPVLRGVRISGLWWRWSFWSLSGSSECRAFSTMTLLMRS